MKIKDANAPFRLMRRTLIEKYIDKMPDNYSIPNIMFTTYFKYFNERVKFLPITFGPRLSGANTLNVKAIVKIGWKAIGEFIVFKKQIDE